MIICFIALFAITSCSDDDVIKSPDSMGNETKTVKPLSRSAEDAVQIATYAASIKGSPTSLSSRGTITDNVVAVTSSTSRSAADTLLYVVNYADNQGYAVISANTNCDALLAVTEQGHFESEESIENPGMKMFFRQAKAISGLGIEYPDRPVNPQRMEWVYDVIEDSVLPRVPVTYGSNPLYPRVTCHAVAAAQVLSIYEQPKTITLQTESNRVLNINWYAFKHINDPMCAFAIDDLYSFMNELAYRMNPLPDGSIYFNKGHDVLKSFIPNNVYDIKHETPGVRGLIKNGGVLVMSGQEKDSNGNLVSPGHAWIVDGYKFKHIIDIEYIVTLDPDTGREISRELSYDNSHTVTYLVHVNWGWSGIDNGYFNYPCFAPELGIHDGSIGGDNPPYNSQYLYNYYYYDVK